MRIETRQVRIGEDMGPIDWSHPIAKDRPQIWRDAEKEPLKFLFNGRPLIKICMYDGWPYWTPTPAIMFIGPLKSAEWTFFNSYDVRDDAIQPVAASASLSEEW